MNSNLNRNRLYYTQQKGKYGTARFNCWSATVFILNKADKLEWMRERDMQQFLDENTEQVAPEDIQAGDIMAMHGWSLDHTAVYLGNGLYFHKKGMNNSERATLEQVCAVYPGLAITYWRIK